MERRWLLVKLLNYKTMNFLSKSVFAILNSLYSDDKNNVPGCEWDGGDCCNNNNAGGMDYCDDCECLDPDQDAEGTTPQTDTTTGSGYMFSRNHSICSHNLLTRLWVWVLCKSKCV